MSIGGMVGAAVLIVIALAAVLQPYLANRRAVRNILLGDLQKSQDELVTSYERVLAMIRDIDEDYQTGKLAPDNYQEERAYWTEQGIKLLQKIEPDNEAELHVGAKSDKADEVLDAEIEKAIAAYREAKA